MLAFVRQNIINRHQRHFDLDQLGPFPDAPVDVLLIRAEEGENGDVLRDGERGRSLAASFAHGCLDDAALRSGVRRPLAERWNRLDEQARPTHLLEEVRVAERDTVVGADLDEVSCRAIAKDLPQDAVLAELGPIQMVQTECRHVVTSTATGPGTSSILM